MIVKLLVALIRDNQAPSMMELASSKVFPIDADFPELPIITPAPTGIL
jgi:hypothetical protein